MQRTKTIKLSEREIEVKELKVRDVWERIAKIGTDTDIKAEVEELLKKCVGLVLEDLQDLYPSEVQELWAAVREVNEGFFVAAEAMNLGEQARKIIRSAARDLNAPSFGLSKEGTV